MWLRARKFKGWQKRLGVYGGAYLLLAVLVMFAGCGDRLILFPSTEKVSALGSTRGTIPFQDGVLETWSARTSKHEPQAFVLVFNGNADRAERALDAELYFWGRQPIEVCAVNYPGYGGSTPPAALARLGPAGLTAYDDLKKRAGERPIFVSGTSLGSAVALHVAAQRRVAGAVLINPPPLRSLILGRFGWWNLWLLAGPVAISVPSDLNSLHNPQRCQAPAVILMSEQDEVVPVKYQRMVFAAYAGPKRSVVATGRHNDAFSNDVDKAFRDELLWLWQQAGVGPSPPTAPSAP